MKKGLIIIATIAIVAILIQCSVNSRADMAVVDEGDKVYAQWLTSKQIAYTILEEYAQAVLKGAEDYQTYLAGQSRLMAEIQRYDRLIRARQDLMGAPDSEIANFYRTVLGWGKFPP